ncbi:MAG TPA: hypothetical protein DCP97_05035 [Ruminococcaceae bacterium]|nr:hypothetical protein [Oscillospiraceae bacterium]
MTDNNAAEAKKERINYSYLLDELEGKSKTGHTIRDDAKPNQTAGNSEQPKLKTDEEAVKQDTKNAPVNAQASVTVSTDKLSAYLLATPPKNGGSDITMEEINAALSKAKVRYGVNNAALEKIVSDKIYDTLVEIAKGEPPVDGEDASIELKFSLPSQIKPKLRQDGSMDFKELEGVVNNVRRGDLLCVVTKETQGKPGMDVSGAIKMQHPGRPLKRNPAGANTVWLENETLLVAQSDGNLEYRGGVISVNKVLTINGSVDMSTGNLDFAGSIVIKGDVRAGFSVKADGSIRIYGVVEGAALTAGGDITVDGGINGMNRGVIVAGGNLKTKFIENSFIEVEGSIFAESIMSSKVRCDGSIEVIAGKGAIIGGSIVAAKNVTAKIIGSQSHIATSITIGSSLILDEKISSLKARISVLNKEVAQLTQIIDYCQPLLNQNKLSPERIKMLKSAVSGKVQKSAELESANIELEQLEAESQSGINSVLYCREQIYTGTKIKIANEILNVSSEISRCTIYLADDKIIIGSY